MTHLVKIQIHVTEAEGVVKWNIYSPDGVGVSRTFGGDKLAALTDACEFVKGMLIDGRTLLEQGRFLADAMGLTIFEPGRSGKRVSKKELHDAATQSNPKRARTRKESKPKPAPKSEDQP